MEQELRFGLEPLSCLKKLSPSRKTIDVFGKPPPSPFPVTGAGIGKGTPSFNVPFRPLYSPLNLNVMLHNSKIFWPSRLHRNPELY